jgi:hypothetical protein
VPLTLYTLYYVIILRGWDKNLEKINLVANLEDNIGIGKFESYWGYNSKFKLIKNYEKFIAIYK